MYPVSDVVSEFIQASEQACAAQVFVKLTLGKAQRPSLLRKVSLSIVTTQSGLRLKCVEQDETQDRTRILTLEELAPYLRSQLGQAFRYGRLFTVTGDRELTFNRRGQATLHAAKAAFQELPSRDHNRRKQHLVETQRPYLQALGITQATGVVKPSMAGKFRQIERFVEILDSLLEELPAGSQPLRRIVDIGCGKGYLTFALYDHLVRQRPGEVQVLGIERRADLVAFCNRQASAEAMTGLHFQAQAASDTELQGVDVLIALHACDTATDDAIYLGVQQRAPLIVCAPCCQHELAARWKKEETPLLGLQRFGLVKQRQAELLTDTLRALLLEAVGYRVKVIEFIATEHTAKNLMLAAVRCASIDRRRAYQQFLDLKSAFGLPVLRLEELLMPDLPNAITADDPRSLSPEEGGLSPVVG
jgi:SAM-dependent methyltransferase